MQVCSKLRPAISIITRLAMVSDSRPLQALWTNAGRLATDGCAPSPYLSEHTDFLVLKLKNEIIRAYRTGKRFFKTGGAVGFDTLAAEVVLQLREHLPELALMVIVPFEGQDIYFSPASKVRYRRILDQADEVVVLSATYFQHCYLRRNAYMVNHASRLIAYYDGVGTGGTSFTVRLAESKQIPVSNLFQ